MISHLTLPILICIFYPTLSQTTLTTTLASDEDNCQCFNFNETNVFEINSENRSQTFYMTQNKYGSMPYCSYAKCLACFYKIFIEYEQPTDIHDVHEEKLFYLAILQEFQKKILIFKKSELILILL